MGALLRLHKIPPAGNAIASIRRFGRSCYISEAIARYNAGLQHWHVYMARLLPEL
jgi:hypothetical protein